MILGSPPAWAPSGEDPQLKQDSEDVFRDVNSARYASYPIKPAVRSIFALDPEFDLNTVDIMGCGSTLGNLLKFASSQPRPFRFDVDLVGDTVLFVRREISPTAIIEDLKGYGHTFPEEYTTWDADVANSCSHQRIVQYEFGGLRLLLRSETDGYLPSKEGGQSITKPAEGSSLSGLARWLAGIALSHRPVPLPSDRSLRSPGDIW